MNTEEARAWMNAPEGIVTMKDEQKMAHKEAWKVNKENVLRWRRDSTTATFSETPGYYQSIIFVLTEYIMSRNRWNLDGK